MDPYLKFIYLIQIFTCKNFFLLLMHYYARKNVDFMIQKMAVHIFKLMLSEDQPIKFWNFYIQKMKIVKDLSFNSGKII
jgi:hypothetical protein